MSTIEFSVVIPLYNKSTHIEATLESVKAQTYKASQVIVVDDGSTDDGAERVEAMMGPSFPTLEMHRQVNGGVSVARNTGIKTANFPFVVFLDGDDLWLPTMLEEMSGLIRSFPQAGGYSTAFAHCLPGGKLKPIQPRFPSRYRKQTQFIYDYFEAAASGELPMMTSATCLPKTVLDEIGGFPPGEKIGEDQDVWIKAGLRYPMAFSRRVCMHYLIEAENRASVMHIPTEECPFSRRLKQYAEKAADARKGLMLTLTANHLLHLAQLNIRSGNLSAARNLLSERRTWRLPLRRVKWELAFWAKKWGIQLPH